MIENFHTKLSLSLLIKVLSVVKIVEIKIMLFTFGMMKFVILVNCGPACKTFVEKYGYRWYKS